ncbi:MAG: hypothetical protein A3H98_09925 [Bacteroidetes bacterium RIFCSPLOWO2_02_FULL_36_8]|nr:MAG: hypothetical protein A3H98_09925 [Bacteroidetes bacterium RIFCSPLOWO2_02_FULL_36_8]OFY70418.1 MAG: hypothetical protein A3G23_09840 [Bacteroidetes bacterium RIFCSPLOWO2_12_FULL_37_12]
MINIFYKFSIFFILFGLASGNSSHGSSHIDSLLALLKKDKVDSNKVNHLNALSNQYISSEPKQALKYTQQALSLAKKINWKNGIANSFHIVGYYYYTQGDYPNTLNYWLKSLKTREELVDKKGIATSLGNIGNVYHAQADYPKAVNYYLRALKMAEELGFKQLQANTIGNIGIVYIAQANYPKALDYYFRVLKLVEELGDKNGMAAWLGNIGIIYHNQADYSKALNYFFQALKMAEELGDKNRIANAFGNIGNVYNEQADYPKALDYYFRAMKMKEELGDKNGIANILGNIGNIYNEQADYSKALDYYFRVLKMKEELGDKKGIAINLGNIGSLYTTKGEETKDEGQKKKLFADAEKYLTDALKIDKEIGAQDHERQFEESLTTLYEKSNRPTLALEHYKKARALKDTIFNEEKSKDMGKLEAKHEYEMTELKRKQQEEENQRQEAVAVGRRNKLQYSGIVIGLMFLFISIFLISKKFKKTASIFETDTIHGNEKIYRRNVKIIEISLFISFLIFFEFISVLLDPFKEQLTGGAPLWKLLINAVVAGAIFPIHNILERKLSPSYIGLQKHGDEREKGGKGEREKGGIGIVIGLTMVMVLNYGFDSKSQIVNRKSKIVNPKLDSLKAELQKQLHDTTRIITLNDLGRELMNINPDTAILLSNQALTLCENLSSYNNQTGLTQRRKTHKENNLLISILRSWRLCVTNYFTKECEDTTETALNSKIQKLKSNTLSNLGVYYHVKGDYPLALDCYFKALTLDNALKNKSGIAKRFGNIGLVYWNQADYPKALDYYFKALKVVEELGDKNGIARQLGNIGIVYYDQSDHSKALDYYLRALKMKEKLGNKNEIANTLGNIGLVYWQKGNYANAIDYYKRALKIAEELGDRNSETAILGNLGIVYKEQGDYPKSLNNYFRALKISEERGDKRSFAINTGNIGWIYTIMSGEQVNERQKKKLIADAEEYLLSALKINKELGAMDNERKIEGHLTELYEKSNRPLLALEHYKKAMALKDTIFNEEKSKDIGKLEARHEFEMTELKRKHGEQEESRKLAVAVGRRNTLQYSGILIGIVVLFSFVLLMGRFKIPVRFVEGLVFILFLIFFEFLLVLSEPYTDVWTGGAPAWKLLVNTVLAGVIFPLHHFLENLIKRRMIASQKKTISKSDEGKNTMKNLLFFVVISAVLVLNTGFINPVDSLRSELTKNLADTTRINLLNSLGWELKYSNPDTSIILFNQALALSEKIKWKRGIANSLRSIGVFNFLKSDYNQALKYYFSSLKITKKIDDKHGTTTTLGNIGVVYCNINEYPKALECYYEALKVYRELSNNNGVANMLCNIGKVHSYQGDYPKTLKYYFDALKIDKELGNKSGIARHYGNIGLVYWNQSNYSKALEYYFESLKLKKELGNKREIAITAGNIGIAYHDLMNYPKALEFYLEALKIKKELGDRKEIAITTGNIGIIYHEQGDYQKALEFYFNAKTLRNTK